MYVYIYIYIYITNTYKKQPLCILASVLTTKSKLNPNTFITTFHFIITNHSHQRYAITHVFSRFSTQNTKVINQFSTQHGKFSNKINHIQSQMFDITIPIVSKATISPFRQWNNRNVKVLSDLIQNMEIMTFVQFQNPKPLDRTQIHTKTRSFTNQTAIYVNRPSKTLIS